MGFRFILSAENVTVSAEFEQVFFESDFIGTWDGILNQRITFFYDNTFIEQQGYKYISRGTWGMAGETSEYGLSGDFTLKTRTTHFGESISIDDLRPIDVREGFEYLYESRCYFVFVSKSSLYIFWSNDDQINIWERVNENQSVYLR
jgi:hypothetical protein